MINRLQWRDANNGKTVFSLFFCLGYKEVNTKYFMFVYPCFPLG